MSKWLKGCLFGIWALLLVPLLAPVLEKWLTENVFSDPHDMGAAAFRQAVDTAVFHQLLAAGQQPWHRLAAVFVTGIVVGISLEWLNRRTGERKAAELRSLGWKFRSLSDSIRTRTAAPGWPDNVRDLRSAMLSVFGAAGKFELWAPNERAFQLPDASFLCEYLKCVGKHLEDGDFNQATKEALSWKPFLDPANRS